MGRLAGELTTIANVVDELDMPVLATVLDVRGLELQEIAVDVILRAAAERSLSQLMGATGRHIAEMGEEEIDEGLLRTAASDIAAERSAELTAAGAALAVRGAVEAEVAGAAAQLASELATSAPVLSGARRADVS